MLALREVHEVPANMHGLLYFFLEITICYVIYWAYMLRKRQFSDVVVWKQEWGKGILAAVGTMASYALILHVMKTENLSYIVTLRQSSVLFAVLIGWFVLREKYGFLRLSVSLAMVAGLYLVATG
jgi:drug/metabolite transporter (DMT)-like permease